MMVFYSQKLMIYLVMELLWLIRIFIFIIFILFGWVLAYNLFTDICCWTGIDLILYKIKNNSNFQLGLRRYLALLAIPFIGVCILILMELRQPKEICPQNVQNIIHNATTLFDIEEYKFYFIMHLNVCYYYNFINYIHFYRNTI